MSPLLFHQATRDAIQQFIAKPSHGLAIVAPPGAGKASTAEYIASKLLQTEVSKLATQPHLKTIRAINGKSIPVEGIREVIQFTTLKTPGLMTRIIVIEDAQLLTLQAQNALLKTIEEPPVETTIMLTVTNELALLPTIRSRIQLITLHPLANQDTIEYFTAAGHVESEVKKALMMSGGLPGLMHALLTGKADHPLLAATEIARDILRKTTFERLTMVDDIAKQRQLWLDILFIIGQMASVAIQQQAANQTAVLRWHRVLSACNQAREQTLTNSQTKLVVFNFMLEL